MSRPVSVRSPTQLADRGAEIGLDAVRPLETVLEQQLHERPVLRSAGGGEVRPQLVVLRQGGHVDQLFDTDDGDAVEGRDPATVPRSPGNRVVTSWSSQPLPSGSWNEAYVR
jgi:hypothetical protein